MREAIYLLRLPFRRIYVLPQKYINEYVWKPDDQISSNTDLYERLLGRWTYIGSLTPDDPSTFPALPCNMLSISVGFGPRSQNNWY